jgi:tetratricopeptide (TPR) repeat protein
LVIGLTACILAQAAVATAAAATPSTVAPVVQPERQADDRLLQAEILITKNAFDEARKILTELAQKPYGERARDNQVQFLLGMLDIHDQDYDSAISRFRRILVSEPGAVRVRLEMGRAYYLSGRYSEAERQFMYARAGKIPKAVRANIDRYLGAVRQRKTFTYGFAIALAPDTNVNAGPATNAVTLYGLPFQLSPGAKANSGVGVMLDTNMEWAPRVGKRAKWRIGGQLHRSQYRQTDFDDLTTSVYTGPRLTLKRWDFNLLGNFARRWYGDRGYTRAYGPSADATYYISPRFGVGVSGAVNRVDYDQNLLQNGLGKTVSLSTFYTPTTSSYVRGAITAGWQGARDPAYAFDSWQFGLAYIREFPGGITASIAPNFTRLDYDAPLAGAETATFSGIRSDKQYAVQLSLLERRLDFHGLTPRIAYTFIRNDSNISLYTFKRSRFELGLTASF